MSIKAASDDSPFEEFHICRSPAASSRVADLLRSAGLDTRTKVAGSEHIIEVRALDLDHAAELFQADLGPSRTFRSGATTSHAGAAQQGDED